MVVLMTRMTTTPQWKKIFDFFLVCLLVLNLDDDFLSVTLILNLEVS
jgi:hypothetical protein